MTAVHALGLCPGPQKQKGGGVERKKKDFFLPYPLPLDRGKTPAPPEKQKKRKNEACNGQSTSTIITLLLCYYMERYNNVILYNDN